MKDCVFTDKIICNWETIKEDGCNGAKNYTKDDMKKDNSRSSLVSQSDQNKKKEKNNIMSMLSCNERYCIGLRGNRIGKLYRLTPDGQRLQIKKSDVPPNVRRKFKLQKYI